MTDLHESETEYTIISDLPGVLENDLSIEQTGFHFHFCLLLYSRSPHRNNNTGPSDDAHIVIQTKRELKYDGIKHSLERVSGSFQRRVAIPHDAGKKAPMLHHPHTPFLPKYFTFIVMLLLFDRHGQRHRYLCQWSIEHCASKEASHCQEASNQEKNSHRSLEVGRFDTMGVHAPNLASYSHGIMASSTIWTPQLTVTHQHMNQHHNTARRGQSPAQLLYTHISLIGYLASYLRQVSISIYIYVPASVRSYWTSERRKL